MRYGFIGVTQKPSNSSLSHPKKVRQYTIKHMHSVTHTVYVGWCMDCTNMQGMNKMKNARQGSLNVNSMLMLLSDIHGVWVLWISSWKTVCYEFPHEKLWTIITKLMQFMDWFLHHENVPAFCYPVCEFLALRRRRRRRGRRRRKGKKKEKGTVIPHPLWSPDLVPCEIFCPRIQNGIK